jgi:hypothetical protein
MRGHLAHCPRVAKALPVQLFPGQAGEQVCHMAPFGRDHLMDQHALFSDAGRWQRALPLAGHRLLDLRATPIRAPPDPLQPHLVPVRPDNTSWPDAYQPDQRGDRPQSGYLSRIPSGGYLRVAAAPQASALDLPLPSRSWAFHPPCSSGSEVVSQPLRPGLADMELSADRAHRGNPVRRQLPGEQLSRPLLQRVRVALGPGRTVHRNLGTADDHHEQLV